MPRFLRIDEGYRSLFEWLADQNFPGTRAITASFYEKEAEHVFHHSNNGSLYTGSWRYNPSPYRGQQLIGAFQPLLDMCWNNAAALAFEPYASGSDFLEDLLSPFFALGNLLKGVFSIVLAPLVFSLSLLFYRPFTSHSFTGYLRDVASDFYCALTWILDGVLRIAASVIQPLGVLRIVSRALVTPFKDPSPTAPDPTVAEWDRAALAPIVSRVVEPDPDAYAEHAQLAWNYALLKGDGLEYLFFDNKNWAAEEAAAAEEKERNSEELGRISVLSEIGLWSPDNYRRYMALPSEARDKVVQMEKLPASIRPFVFDEFYSGQHTGVLDGLLKIDWKSDAAAYSFPEWLGKNNDNKSAFEDVFKMCASREAVPGVAIHLPAFFVRCKEVRPYLTRVAAFANSFSPLLQIFVYLAQLEERDEGAVTRFCEFFYPIAGGFFYPGGINKARIDHIAKMCTLLSNQNILVSIPALESLIKDPSDHDGCARPILKLVSYMSQANILTAENISLLRTVNVKEATDALLLLSCSELPKGMTLDKAWSQYLAVPEEEHKDEEASQKGIARFQEILKRKDTDRAQLVIIVLKKRFDIFCDIHEKIKYDEASLQAALDRAREYALGHDDSPYPQRVLNYKKQEGNIKRLSQAIAETTPEFFEALKETLPYLRELSNYQDYLQEIFTWMVDPDKYEKQPADLHTFALEKEAGYLLAAPAAASVVLLASAAAAAPVNEAAAATAFSQRKIDALVIARGGLADVRHRVAWVQTYLSGQRTVTPQDYARALQNQAYIAAPNNAALPVKGEGEWLREIHTRSFEGWLQDQGAVLSDRLRAVESAQRCHLFVMLRACQTAEGVAALLPVLHYLVCSWAQDPDVDRADFSRFWNLGFKEIVEDLESLEGVEKMLEVLSAHKIFLSLADLDLLFLVGDIAEPERDSSLSDYCHWMPLVFRALAQKGILTQENVSLLLQRGARSKHSAACLLAVLDKWPRDIKSMLWSIYTTTERAQAGDPSRPAVKSPRAYVPLFGWKNTDPSNFFELYEFGRRGRREPPFFQKLSALNPGVADAPAALKVSLDYLPGLRFDYFTFSPYRGFDFWAICDKILRWLSDDEAKEPFDVLAFALEKEEKYLAWYRSYSKNSFLKIIASIVEERGGSKGIEERLTWAAACCPEDERTPRGVVANYLRAVQVVQDEKRIGRLKESNCLPDNLSRIVGEYLHAGVPESMGVLTHFFRPPVVQKENHGHLTRAYVSNALGVRGQAAAEEGPGDWLFSASASGPSSS